MDNKDIITNYVKEIDENLEYSLDVDPYNRYDMTDEQKSFVKYYIEFKNIPLACKAARIDKEIGEAYFMSYSTQQEIRRINKALYHRQFITKMMSLDDLGGYLTSLITDENVPLADRLKTKEKLEVVRLLMALNDSKDKYIDNPSSLVSRDVEEEVKNLSVETIKQLLETDSKNSNKKDLVKELNNEKKFSPEELSYLESLPAKDLLAMIETLNDRGDKKNEG